MNMSIENLDKCLYYIINNTKLEELLNLTFGNALNDTEMTDIATLVLESMFIEEISDLRKKMLDRQYGYIGIDRKNMFNEDADCRQKNIELNVYDFMPWFINTFGSKFEYGSLLLKKIRKKFASHRFKEINIINDVSVMFFAFRLFDYFCDYYDDEDERKIVAENIANSAYNALKHTKSHPQATVTPDSLLMFLKGFEFDNCVYAYVFILVDFIQAVYTADIKDVERYLIFSRFEKHILYINAYLNNFSSLKNVSKKFVDDEFKDYKKVYKFVSNKLQKLKKSDNGSELAIIIKTLQGYIQKFPKCDSDFEKISNKRFYKLCSDIYGAISELSKYRDGQFSNIVEDVIQNYNNLSFDDNGMKISIFSIIATGLNSESHNGFNKIVDKIEKDNVYIKLIFSMGKFENMETSRKVRLLYGEVMGDIYEYVKNNFAGAEYEESNKLYSDVIGRVNLNVLSMPILCLDRSSIDYRDKLNTVQTQLFC